MRRSLSCATKFLNEEKKSLILPLKAIEANQILWSVMCWVIYIVGQNTDLVAKVFLGANYK